MPTPDDGLRRAEVVLTVATGMVGNILENQRNGHELLRRSAKVRHLVRQRCNQADLQLATRLAQGQHSPLSLPIPDTRKVV